jgi:Phage tail lysozyme
MLTSNPFATKTLLLSAALTLPVLLAGCAGVEDPNENISDQTSAVVSEDGNDKTAFDFFVSKGLSKVQAAGIVGNLDQESGMDPSILQYGGGPGRGIAQWSAGGRWDASYHDNVVWYASEHGQSPWSLGLQLDFIWYELTTFGYGYADLRAAGSIDAAVGAFQDYYEICGECESSNRIAHAEAAYDDFAGASGGGTAPDACDEPSTYCTGTLQCYDGHWIVRQDDPNACDGTHDVEIACHEGDGYCTETLQCDGGHWVPRTSDPDACTSGPG